MIGVVNINGFIGEPDIFFDGEVNTFTTLLDIVKQIESNQEAESFNVFINSQGGIVEDGYKIFNYLKTLGKPVNTFINGQCFSIATVIFLAGIRRIINTSSEFMIHAPWTMTIGDANQLEDEAEQLRDLENELVNFYHKHTGISKAALKSLIESDTFLTPDEAVSLGFATEIKQSDDTSTITVTTMKAVAFSNTLNQNKMSDKTTNKISGQLEKLMSGVNKILGRFKAVGIVLQDSNSVEIDFPDVEEGQTPAVGDRGLIAGAPVPNMEGSDVSVEYIMPQLDNAVVVFRDGVVWQINPASADDDSEEMVALKAEVEDLKTQLTEKETELDTANTEKDSIKTDVLALKTEIGTFKALAGSFNFDGNKKPSKKDGEGKKSSGIMKAEWYDNN